MSNQKSKAKTLKFPAFDAYFTYFTFAIFGVAQYLGNFFSLPIHFLVFMPFTLFWLWVSFAKYRTDEELKKVGALFDEEKTFALWLEVMREK